MKPNRKIAIIVTCLVALSIIVARGSDNRARVGEVRTLSLPSFAVLDESAQPLLASSGKIGFISSVTNGSLISFSTTSGEVLSSIVVGESAGPISMVEIEGRRLISVPAANNPTGGSPATVSIIDAAKSKRLELKSLLVLPADALITPASRAVMTSDGRYCLIASSSDNPTLYLFDIESGQLRSQLKLAGRPSDLALHDEGTERMIAVASSTTSELSVINIDQQGQLTLLSTFTPAGARLDDSNNPAFSADGRRVFIASSASDQIYMVDSASGIQIDMIAVEAPQTVSVARGSGGVEMIAATRIRRPINMKPGGVTIIKNDGDRLAIQSEFTPPEGVEFSRANNVAFTADGSSAFVGSTTGVLFAFSTDTGELESYNAIGNELRRIALNDQTNTIAIIKSSRGGDEIALVNFDRASAGETDPNAPVIEQLSPDTVEQGRMKNLQLSVAGKNFTEGASLLVNGLEVAADLGRGGRSLDVKLPRSLFDNPAVLSIQIKAVNGSVSAPRELRVIRPGAPVIDTVTPSEVPGPSAAFTLRVKGRNFRQSSTIVIADHSLNTLQTGDGELSARVPVELARVVGNLKVQVKDLAVTDLVSANEKEVRVFGPRINELRSDGGAVVAGDRGFVLRIKGENFRSGAEVQISGRQVPQGRILFAGRTQINVAVPQEFYQEAGKLSVVVLNPEGGASESKELAVRAPEIKSIGSGKVFAGTSDVKVTVRGQNFRRGARVYVGNSSGAFRVAKSQVRFLSSRRIVVTLGGEVNRLLDEPGALRFSVVNPNSADGVASVDQYLKVVGPSISDASIKPAEGDSVTIAIDGANFRNGAIVEFLKDGAVVRQQIPLSFGENRLLVVVPVSKVEALGQFTVRVVNPGNVPSDLSQPHTEISAASNN